jgi:hypothetical protein
MFYALRITTIMRDLFSKVNSQLKFFYQKERALGALLKRLKNIILSLKVYVYFLILV